MLCYFLLYGKVYQLYIYMYPLFVKFFVGVGKVLENSAKSRTLSNFTFTFHFPALEKETATHSSVLAWRIPGMGEPGGLPSMGSHRVGHD